MSDVTFGVKVSPEVKERVSAMIEASGLKSKEWFESLLSLYEMQRLKEGTVDFAKDLSELEIHTNRIVQLVGNMVTRATHEKEAVLQQIEGIKASRDEVIIGYQQELAEVKGQIQQYREQAEDSAKVKNEAEKRVIQLQEAAENHRDLIGQYKEKIDTLSGLVAEYRAHSEERHQLKETVQALGRQVEEQTAELVKHDKSLAMIEEKYSSQITEMSTRHKEELTRLTERLEFEKERALLQLRTEYEGRIAKLREERADRIEALQAEINELRKPTQHPKDKNE